MDRILIEQIRVFLQKQNPTDEEIRQGATLLLRMNPSRERGIYNSAMARPKAMLPWIRTDLKKYFDIRQRGLETEQVEKYNRETLEIVRETLEKAPEGEDENGTEDESPAESPAQCTIPVLGIRGKRADHDQLPADIQELWEENIRRWRKMRALHAQLALMMNRPGYAACDGNELCYQLRQLDEQVRQAYLAYDEFKADDGQAKEPEKKDEVEAFTDNVKTIQNARTAITRVLQLEHPSEDKLKKLQEAVNTLLALHQTFKPEQVERLKAVGIVFPEAGGDA